MNSVVNETTDGILNRVTQTIHKHEPGGTAFQTACGLTEHVTHDDLYRVRVKRAISTTDVSKCGRCFPDAGGY